MAALARLSIHRQQAMQFPLFGQRDVDPVRVSYLGYLLHGDGDKKPLFKAILLGCGGGDAEASAARASAAGAGSGVGIADASALCDDQVVVVKFVPTGRRSYGQTVHEVR
jgi:hypothetical protein